MTKPLLLVPLLFAACSFPRFTASKTVDKEVPADTAAKLLCETHNGDIEITGEPGRESISLTAVIQVRGFTQQEADDKRALVDVGHTLDGQTLEIFGDYDKAQFDHVRPSFSYVMRVPVRLALELVTHNGNVRAEGTSGALSIETHNGSVHGRVDHTQAHVVSHNGSIELELAKVGDVEADVTTHNGRIEIAVPRDASAWIDAQTHNGSITGPDGMSDVESSKRRLRGRIGGADTKGSMQLTTHNGSIEIVQGRQTQDHQQQGHQKPN